jgi:hypothetical protein
MLGIDPTAVPADAEAAPVLTNAELLESWRAFLFVGLLLALVYGVFWLYRREINTCPRGMRLLLAAVRALVLVVLAAVLLGPALAIAVRQQVRPHVLVMLDESASMSLPDRYLDDEAVRPVAAVLGRTPEAIRAEQPRRATIVNDLLTRQDHQFLRQLEDKGNVVMMTFAGKVTARRAVRLGVPEAGPDHSPAPNEPATAGSDVLVATPDVLTLPAEPAGQGTNLAQAIREGLKAVSGDVAAIILFTDGQHTVTHDEVRDAARAAGQQNVPVFPVGVGDASRPRNLEVAEAVADDPAWQGDPLEIRAILRHYGMEQAAVTIELAVEPIAEGGTAQPRTVIERRSVTLVPDPTGEPGAGGETGAQQTVTFTYTPQKAGQYRFTVRVPALPEERDETDNEERVLVQVLSEKARVLLIAGVPSWDYRFVQAVLKRDKSIDVSCWLQTMDPEMPQEGDTRIESLPRTETELFKYDLIMMFDPNPLEFNEAWIEALKTFLGKHGGGFLYAAGPQHATNFLSGFRTRGLRTLLPVEIPDDLTSLDVQSLLETHARGWPLRPVPANLDQSIMAFDSDPRINAQRWERMPPVYWSFPATRARPAARVLLEHTDPATRRGEENRPLLVSGQFGPGRTLYLGFNSSWRWRRLGRDAEYFHKFWIQTVRFLVEGRLLKGKRRGHIEIPGEEFIVGDRVTVRAELYDRSYQELIQPSVTAQLRSDDGRASNLELKAVEGKRGWYEGTVPASTVGFNELRIQLEGDQPGQPVELTRRFRVRVPDVERRQTQLNKGLLVELAQLSGGKYVDVHQLDTIPAAIVRAPETIVVPGKPIELWSTNRLLWLLVVLLTVEWALRKRYKLL